MSSPTVTVPVGLAERLRERLGLRALELRQDPDRTAISAHVAEALGDERNLLNDTLTAAAEFAGPDFEAMLGEVLEAVQLQGGRQGHATADRAGVDAALAALRELGPLLAPQAGAVTLAQLREAVRVQTPVFDMECYSSTRNPTTGERKLLAEMKNVECARIPIAGERIVDAEGRVWRVCETPLHRGASVLLTVEGTGVAPTNGA